MKDKQHSHEGPISPQTEVTGRIVRRSGKHYWVLAGERSYRCELRGRLRDGETVVLVGDNVQFQPLDETEGCIESVMPRTSELSRQVGRGNRAKQHYYCANVDTVVIVSAVKAPPIRPALIDRLLVTAQYEELSPVICLNKMDLDPSEEVKAIMDMYQDLGYEVFRTSTETGEGIPALAERLCHGVSVFSGHSGVGKTSLLQELIPGFQRKTLGVTKRARGRHSTTEVYLVALPDGGFVVDTPGFREFTVWGVPPESIDSYYPEFMDFIEHCKYYNCMHLDEPECAVLAAVEAGAIDPLRYMNYLRLIETHSDG